VEAVAAQQHKEAPLAEARRRKRRLLDLQTFRLIAAFRWS
jgi:hypothetical protein